MAQPTVTPFEPGLIARVVAGARYVFNGEVPDWFGPGTPPAAVVDESQKDSVAGRQNDFPVGYNLRQQPRSGEAVSFAQMRALADGYDLMRLVIETRKEQMAKLKWTVKPKEVLSKPGRESGKPDARCDELIAFLQFPDKEHDWNTWLRMLLEDLLVIDAPTVYPRKTVGGKLYALEPIDGATIKRVLDQRGRTPLPPAPAYQQVLKGMSAVDYTLEELIYQPRNPRTHKVYGYSPVEQVITTVNIALRRQAHQLGFYTEGSTPDLIFSVPETWSAEQIKQFEMYWNDVMAGNLAERRKTRFVPSGVTPFDTKSAALKDEYDEWLARIICYAFSVSPQPFVKEMNRATAQAGQEAALAEGLAPLQEWVKSLIDRVITLHFGYADLEFCWAEEVAIKPLDQAQISKIYVEAKVLHPDEVRADLGKPPLTPEQKEDMAPAPPPALAPTGDGPPPPAKPKEALAKAKKPLRLIDRERDAVVQARSAVASTISGFLSRLGAQLAKTALSGQVQKDDEGAADHSPAQFEQVIAQARWDLMAKEVRKQLKALARDGVVQGFALLGVENGLADDVLQQANKLAVAYADDRAAEMVGMKWLDDELVPNPDAQWVISDTTRIKVNALVVQATEEGWSSARLSEALQDSTTFSDARAEMIARTECAFADSEGNLAAYQASGQVIGVEWVTGTGCCDACAALDGKKVALGKPFPHGRGSAPAHPHCRCDVLPVLTGEPMKDVVKEALAKGKGGNPNQPRDAHGRFAATGSAKSFVMQAKASPGTKQEPHVIGHVSAATANKAQELGIDLKGKAVALDHDGVLHSLKKHGGESERKRGQVPITHRDFALLGRLLERSEKMSLGDPARSKNGAARLSVEATAGPYRYSIALEVRRKAVIPVTMFKRRK